jgi:hypothetical protein
MRGVDSRPARSSTPILGSLAPLAVGCVLVFAAILKSHQLWTEPMFQAPIFGSRGYQAAFAELELFFGLILWSGILPKVARVAAILLFLAFLSIALTSALSSTHSCGCFGKVELGPWAAVFLDVVILITLSGWRASSVDCSRHAKITLGLAFAVACPWPVLAASRLPPFPQLLSNSPVELGSIKAAQRRTFQLELENPHEGPIDIEVLEASCSCLEMNVTHLSLPPHSKRIIQLALDLSKEPNFTGDLAIQIVGKTVANQRLFIAEMRAKVEN